MPISSKALRVQTQSSPASTFVKCDVPSASAPNMIARCERDLSPGKESVPESGRVTLRIFTDFILFFPPRLSFFEVRQGSGFQISLVYQFSDAQTRFSMRGAPNAGRCFAGFRTKHPPRPDAPNAQSARGSGECGR